MRTEEEKSETLTSEMERRAHVDAGCLAGTEIEPTMPRRYAAVDIGLPCNPTPDVLFGGTRGMRRHRRQHREFGERIPRVPPSVIGRGPRIEVDGPAWALLCISLERSPLAVSVSRGAPA
jgi:hypothetical protein